MPRLPANSVSEEVLRGLQAKGITSPFLEARLKYADASQLLSQHLGPMAGHPRVYPNLCSPQASGRVSTSRPPLGNFTADQRYGPHGLRDVVQPDPGEVWVCFDLDAVEARLIAHCSKDEGDLEAFRRGYDLHTVTAIRMFKWPDPPFEPTKAHLFGDRGREWCGRVGALLGRFNGNGQLIPYSESDRYRRLAKNIRYALNYAKDEKAAARYAVEMKMTRDELYRHARAYLNAKPALMAWKRQTWAACWRTHEARTAFGRRRRLWGPRVQVEKEGLNHVIQGTVADVMKQIIAGVEANTRAIFVMQTHDGAKFRMREGMTGDLIPYVEHLWDLWGSPLFIPASWEVLSGQDS